MKKRSVNWKDLLSIYGPGLVVIVLGFYVTQYFIKPAPPKEISIAAGQKTGAYYQFAEQYAAYMANEGITLHVRETAGSIENISLLQNGEVDIAFIQGGTLPQEKYGNMEGLASLYYEPLWLFHQKGLHLARMGQLETLKVSIGAEGSGTYSLVRRLLEENQIDDPRQQLFTFNDVDASNALLTGTVDAAFFVTRPGTPLLGKLMAAEHIRVASFERAKGYAKRFHYLSALLLPEGSQDFVHNRPDRDIELLAPTASLAVDADIHPAIVDLVMQAAYAAHHSSGWFESDDQFPSSKYLELPLNEQAARFYKYGPPFLQRYLPFWAASMIDRLKIMLLPLIILLIPVFKVMPPLYQWRMRARIFRLYNKLDGLDPDVAQIRELSIDERTDLLEKLALLDDEAHDLKVPVAFSDRLYFLRQHIVLVRRELLKQESVD